jgi:hypothetical protein
VIRVAASTRILLALLVAALSLAALGSPAAARHGDEDRDEVRVPGRCTGRIDAELKLKRDDGRIEVEFEIDQDRAGVVWRLALVHERRGVWRGRARSRRPSGSLEIRRLLADLRGSDTVVARAWGPRGLTCRATATLADS